MERPHVIVHATVSVDGRMTLSPDVLLLHGDERWQAVAGSSGEIYERLKRSLKPQAILEGSGSFVVDGAEPEALPPLEGDREPLLQDYLPGEVIGRRGHRGWFTIVDGRGRARGWIKEWYGEEWAGWHLLVAVCSHTPARYLAYLRREEIPYLVAGGDQVDLSLTLNKLHSQLGVERLLSTSGGRLSGALVRAGLVDEVSIEYFPAIIGGYQTPSLFDSPELAPDEWPTRLRLISARVEAKGHVWLRYEVDRDG